MKEKILLNKEELKIINQLIKSCDIVGKEISLNNLINKWSEFIYQIKNGYNYTIYDYCNDLGIRDILERIIDNTFAELKNKLQVIIEPYDSQYKSLTKISKHPVRKINNIDKHWWWSRIPLNPTGELLDDLIHEGLLNK